MKKYLLIMMTVLAAAAYVFAGQAVMSIAVLDLDANGVAGNEARDATDRLRSELIAINKFEVMGRGRMDTLLAGRKEGDAASMKNLIETGRDLGVNGVVSGSIGRIKGGYLLSALLVDVETGMILATATEEFGSADGELAPVMNRAAQRLAGVEKRAEFTVSYYDKSNAAKGNFYIKSEPAGATVFLNGKMIRNVVTPLTIEDLPSGDYRISAEKVDSAKSADVSLRPNEFRKITLVLEKKQGRLSVGANVPQSDVYLNGQFLGKTPVTVNALDLGAYTLLVRKEGFIDFTKQIRISDLEQAAVEAELVRPGPLKVLSTPMEAEVWLDNEHKGATPMVLDNLPPGTHVLELRKEGYAVRTDTVEIVSDREVKVEPVLEPLKGPGHAAGLDKGQTGVGGGFDKTMKWLTIGGSAAFAVILGIVLAR
jgi:TolB-like protein